MAKQVKRVQALVKKIAAAAPRKQKALGKKLAKALTRLDRKGVPAAQKPLMNKAAKDTSAPTVDDPKQKATPPAPKKRRRDPQPKIRSDWTAHIGNTHLPNTDANNPPPCEHRDGCGKHK